MSLNIPVLGYTSPFQSHVPATPERIAPERIIVGSDGLTLDGKPFPWATVGEWVIKIADDSIATLTVNIAISLPADPDAVPV